MKSRALDLRGIADERMIARFWSMVEVPDHEPATCWTWARGRMAAGYGQFYPRKGMAVGAHRVGLALANGLLLPAGTYACHTCDNPPCVRPSHLFIGTPTQNAVDCLTKGRATRAAGERHPAARLTEEQVREIRNAPTTYGTKTEMARRFGVSLRTVSAVLKGELWKDT